MAVRETRQSARYQEHTSRKADRRRAVHAFGTVAAVSVILGIVSLILADGSAAGLTTVVSLAIGLFLVDGIMRKPGGIPCVTWHSVSADARWLPWSKETAVAPATLDRQLFLINRMGLAVIDTRQFVLMRKAGRPVPENAVMLHFDDGYLDNFIAAAPILQKHGMSATMFVSLDFVAPDRDLPVPIDLDAPGALGEGYAGRWDGYLSWREIAVLDKDAFGGVFDIQPHGVDHSRVPVGNAKIGELTARNWREHAWMQWAKMPGNKHDWYHHALPPAVPIGTPIPPSESALAARAWREDGSGLETPVAFEARVLADFSACFDAFSQMLDKVPQIFCWPQNRATPVSRAIAEMAGFIATTGGKGCNRTDENPAIISRLHAGERYAGFDSRLLDDFAFRASIRAFQGNNYWYLALIPIQLLKKAYQLKASRDSAVAAGHPFDGCVQ